MPACAESGLRDLSPGRYGYTFGYQARHAEGVAGPSDMCRYRTRLLARRKAYVASGRSALHVMRPAPSSGMTKLLSPVRTTT